MNLSLFILVLVAAVSSQNLQQLVDAQYKKMADSTPWMGLSVGIIYKGQTSFYSYGQNITKSSLFSINSCTKVFTALAAAVSSVRNRISLRDPIQQYIPKVRIPKDQTKRQITFVDLATHYSGLPRVPGNFPDPDNHYFNYTDALFYQNISDFVYAPDNRIGTTFLYSNLGFGLLADVLAKMDNKDFSRVMSDSIFKPLSMSYSYTIEPSHYESMKKSKIINKKTSSAFRKDQPFQTIGHSETGEIMIDDVSTPEACLGSWAIRSNAIDMVKFLQANLYVDDSTILGKAINITQIPLLPCYDGFLIGLAWELATATGTIQKTGSGEGYESIMLVNRPAQVAIVVMSDSYFPPQYDDFETQSVNLINQIIKLKP